MWKKENGCFILLWRRDWSQVKLRALIWEWCYYRSLGVGYTLNWEASHMRTQQRQITWGAVGALLQWGFILFTTRLKCSSVMFSNQVNLLAAKHSLSWPTSYFIIEPVLPICVLSGLYLDTEICSVISRARHVLKVIYLLFTFTFGSYSEGLASFSSKDSTHFRSQGQNILITLYVDRDSDR